MTNTFPPEQSKEKGKTQEWIKSSTIPVWVYRNTIKHHIEESQEVSPFSAGDHKAERHKEDNMAKTNTNKNKIEVPPWQD